MTILKTLLTGFFFFSNANNTTTPLLELPRQSNIMKGIVLGNRDKEVLGSVVMPFSMRPFDGSSVLPDFFSYFQKNEEFNSNLVFNYVYSAVYDVAVDFANIPSDQFVRSLSDFQVWESNSVFTKAYGFGQVKYISFQHDNKNYLLLSGFHSLFKERNKDLFNSVTHCFMACTKLNNYNEIHSFYGSGSCFFVSGPAIKRVNINSNANRITSLNFNSLPNLEEFFMKWRDERLFPVFLKKLDLSNTSLKKVPANFVSSHIEYLSLSGCRKLKSLNSLFAQGASFCLDVSGVDAKFENPYKLYWSLKNSSVIKGGFEFDGLDFYKQVVKA